MTTRRVSEEGFMGGLEPSLRSGFYRACRVFEATRIESAVDPCNEDPGTLARGGTGSCVGPLGGLNTAPSGSPGGARTPAVLPP